VNPTRPAELEPLIEKVAILIENLNSIVLTIADEKPPTRIHSERMWDIELAGSRSLRTPCFDEFALR
jgi:hypothetical protein